MPPQPRFWEPGPQYAIPENPPEDFRFEDLYTNPFPGSPNGNPDWWYSPYGSEAERLQDYYRYEPSMDGTKGAVWNITDRAMWNPSEAQAAYDAIQFSGSGEPGLPGDSFLESAVVGQLESMGFRPSHAFGDPVFYSLDSRGGVFKLVRWEGGVGTTIYEGNDRGMLDLAYDQIGQELGLDGMDLRNFRRTGFLVSYPYPEGNRQEVEAGVPGADAMDPNAPDGQHGWGRDWWGGQESPIPGLADMGPGQSQGRDPHDQAYVEDLETDRGRGRGDQRTGPEGDQGRQLLSDMRGASEVNWATRYAPGQQFTPIDQVPNRVAGGLSLEDLGYRAAAMSPTYTYHQGDQIPNGMPNPNWLQDSGYLDDAVQRRLEMLAKLGYQGSIPQPR